MESSGLSSNKMPNYVTLKLAGLRALFWLTSILTLAIVVGDEATDVHGCA